MSDFQEWAKSFDQIVWSKNDLNYCKLAWDKATNISESESQARIDELQAENKLIQIELGATQHAFTDYRASYAMKACMMCNSLERVHCYANTERLEAKVAELEAENLDMQSRIDELCPTPSDEFQAVLDSIPQIK